MSIFPCMINIKVKDFFDYEHLQPTNAIIVKIQTFLTTADSKDIELVYKFITDLQQYKK